MTDRPRLLVADDYPENRRLFSVYLRKAYDVVAVSSGEEAVEQLQTTPVVAALLDINYQGGMSGYDVVRWIRGDARLAALPTVALTAHASPEDRRQCLEAGFDDYLSKPVTRAEMLASLAALIARDVAA